MHTPSYWEKQHEVDSSASSRSRPLVWLFLSLSFVGCIAGALLVPGGMGFLAGYQELHEQNHEAAIVHFNRGLGYQAENYPELARSEFEIALKYDSTFEPARRKLAEFQTSGGTPNGSSSENQVSATLLGEARAFVTNKEWDDAIVRLEQLRTLKADYRPAEVNDLRYQAYVGGGKAAVVAGQIELARERFEAALTIRSDPGVARDRDLAVLYLDGQQAVGYNWQTAIAKFSALYQQEPGYDDVKRRLFDAYSQYGDLAAKQSAWCLAAKEYDGALALNGDAGLSQKRTQVMSLCKQALSATPTPALAVGTENYVWKISTTNDRPCSGTGDIVGFVRDALGRLLIGVPVGYYADGIPLVNTRANANGQYQFTLGKDPGLIHVVILGVDGKTPSSLTADVQYPGGSAAGCHIQVDWQRVQ